MAHCLSLSPSFSLSHASLTHSHVHTSVPPQPLSYLCLITRRKALKHLHNCFRCAKSTTSGIFTGAHTAPTPTTTAAQINPQTFLKELILILALLNRLPPSLSSLQLPKRLLIIHLPFLISFLPCVRSKVSNYHFFLVLPFSALLTLLSVSPPNGLFCLLSLSILLLHHLLLPISLCLFSWSYRKAWAFRGDRGGE